VLCSYRDDPRKCEPLHVRPIFVGGYKGDTPNEQLNPKRKVWEKIAADLKTNNATDGNAQLVGWKTLWGAKTDLPNRDAGGRRRRRRRRRPAKVTKHLCRIGPGGTKI
jgi:hypothetical protein